jgi:predicted DNA-binding helix-hairpin-helix protein
VPGIGIQSAMKIIAARRFATLGWEHLKKIGIAFNRAKYFVVCNKEYEIKDWQPALLKQQIVKETSSKYAINFSPQLNLFG